MTIDIKKYRDEIAEGEELLLPEDRDVADRVFAVHVPLGEMKALLDVYEAAREWAEVHSDDDPVNPDQDQALLEALQKIEVGLRRAVEDIAEATHDLSVITHKREP